MLVTSARAVTLESTKRLYARNRMGTVKLQLSFEDLVAELREETAHEILLGRGTRAAAISNDDLVRLLAALAQQAQPRRVRVPSAVYQFALNRLDKERAVIGDLNDPEAQRNYATSIKRLRDFLSEATEVHDFYD
jgi:hypothetical protein